MRDRQGGETIEVGGILDRLRVGLLTSPAVMSHAEGGETRPVASGGAGFGVGADAGLAADPGFAATPGAAHEVGDLAFHFRAGAAVGLLPVGLAWAALCSCRRSSRACTVTLPPVANVRAGTVGRPNLDVLYKPAK